MVFINCCLIVKLKIKVFIHSFILYAAATGGRDLRRRWSFTQVRAELAGADVHVADVAPQQAVDVAGAQVNRAGQVAAPLHLAPLQRPEGQQPLERAQVVLEGRLGCPDLPPVAAEHLSRQVLRVAVPARSRRRQRSTTEGFFGRAIDGKGIGEATAAPAGRPLRGSSRH